MTEVIKSLIETFVRSTQDKVDFPLDSGADYFARTGEWVTVHFAHLAKNWVCCEINDAHRYELAANMPGARLIFADSFTQLDGTSKFDLVLADCPQGVFGSDGAYCEHFEFLPQVMGQMAEQTVLFFNVNVQPYENPEHASNRPDNYGMTNFDAWIARRNAFYKTSSNERLDEDFIQEFYTDFFAGHGYRLDRMEGAYEPSNLPGHPPFIRRQIALLSRI